MPQFRNLTYLTLLFGLLTLIRSAQGLQCYVCNSEYETGCDSSPPASQYLKDCSEDLEEVKHWYEDAKINDEVNSTTGVPTTTSQTMIPADGSDFPKNYTFCRKITVEIPSQHNGDSIKPEEKRIVRVCGWESETSAKFGIGKCSWGPSDYVKNYLCTCKGDACNNAERSEVRLGGLILTILPAILLKYLAN